MHKLGSWVKCFFFLTLLVIPSIAWANKLSILDVETPQPQSDAQNAALSVYFDYRSIAQIPITGLKADQCTISIDGKTPNVVQSELLPFTEGDLGVGVLFIFPTSKNYSEDSFGIRSSLKNLLQRLDRKIDQLNVVTYERGASIQGWSMASEKMLIKQLDAIRVSDVIEPNLFASFAPTISAFDSLKGTSQKYLVLISDAEGEHFGNNELATMRISAFIDKLHQNNIIPIVVAYSPDGRYAMSNIHHIQRIATELNGYYFVAESESMFQQIMLSNVYNAIYGKYLLKTTLDMSGDNYLPSGKNYPLELTVSTTPNGADADHAAAKIDWPELSTHFSLINQDFSADGITPWEIMKYLIILVFGVLIGVGIVLTKRNS